MINKKFLTFFIVTVIAVGVWGSIFKYFEQNRDYIISENLEDSVRFQKIAWNSILDKYNSAMRAYYEAYILRDEVIDIIKDMNNSNIEIQNIARAKLYRKLYPLYSNLEKRYLRQLHFHTKDNLSFLRFHKIDKSGDSLVNIRYSVEKANRDLVEVSGFETGRVISGFRNVYPIIYNNVHYGSVEFSQPFKALHFELAKLDLNVEHVMVISKESLSSKLFKEQSKLYQESQFSSDWVIEDAKAELSDSPQKISEITFKLMKTLKNDVNFQQLLKVRDYKSLYLEFNSKYYVITATPIIDVENSPSSLILSFKEAPNIKDAIDKFHKNIFILTVIMVILVGLIYLEIINRYKIRESEARFKLITNTMSEGLYVMSRGDGFITEINESACKFLGFNRDELIGNVAHYKFHSHSKNSNLSLEDCGIFKTAISGKRFDGEDYFLRKDGTDFIVEVSSVPITKDDQIIGTVTVFRDITERKLAQQALESFNKKLQEQVEIELQKRLEIEEIYKKERETQQSLIIQQSKLAELGNLIGIIAHQWMQPLNTMNLLTFNLVDMYEYNELNETSIKDFSDKIHQQIEFMVMTINEFRDFYKPSKEKSIFNIKDGIKALLYIIEGQLRKYSIEVKLNSLDECYSFGYPNEFKHVILNIVNNAKDVFIERDIVDRVINIDVSVNYDYYRITIEDSGGGIPEAIIDKVFEPYTSTKGVKGTGIGLSLSRTIIEQKMGGKIAVTNGAFGAKFIIDIPKYEKEEI